MEKKRQIDIELMRILAAFFVIFNHTGNQGFLLYSCYDSHSLRFWGYLFLSIFCKFSVSLFFMIAGALMLNRETASYSRFLKTKVFRMLLILVIWSVFYYLISVYNGRADLSLSVFLRKLCASEWLGSFWYLYAYIPFLLAVPILQRIAKSLSDKEYLYVFTLVFFFSILLPVGEYLLWKDQYFINDNFNLNWMSTQGFICPLLGYFLQHRASAFWNKRRLGMLWLMNIAAILLTCYLTYEHLNRTGSLSEENLQRFHEMFVVVNSTAVFTTCQYFVKNRNLTGSVQKLIVSLGGTTFGVYLLHILIMVLFNNMNIMDKLYEIFQMREMLSAIVYCAGVFAVGSLITKICQKIPFIKHVIS